MKSFRVASKFLSINQDLGKSGCSSKETCAREESLHGEDESDGILPFTSESLSNATGKLDKFFHYV